MKNYKVVVLGDIHGTIKWKKVIEQNKNADKIIFLGDYFDSFTIPFEEQKKNFAEILVLKKEQPERVVLLFGNHEYHYLSAYSNDHYSGYQNYEAYKIDEILTNVIKEGLIQVAYEYNKYIFTHAGITKEWCESNKIDMENIVKSINSRFLKNPSIFKFTPSTGFDRTGDSITQSPIWVRPRALESNKIEGVKQVVGHTHQKNIDVSKDIIYIDTLENGNEYLIIEDDILEVGFVNENQSNCCDYPIISGRCSNPSCLEMCN